MCIAHMFPHGVKTIIIIIFKAPGRREATPRSSRKGGTAATGGLKSKGAEESRRKGKEAPIWQQTLAKAQANAPAGPQAGSGPPEPSQGAARPHTRASGHWA